MLDINGAAQAPLDPSHLPYAMNGGAGPRWLIPVAIFATILMLTLNAVGYTSINSAIVLAPPALLALHLILFFSIRNATNMALAAHAHNERLDHLVEVSRQNFDRGRLSQNRLAQITQGRPE